MRPSPWKVGELARWTGVSVRTLHYYDEIGLLRPAQTTEAGYRLYTEGDVIRLQQVKSLRHLGFSLEEIKNFLARPEVSPGEVLRMQITHLKEQITQQQRLCERLEAIAGRWGKAESVSTEELLQIIEVMNMMDKYYTPEQTEELRQRREQLGDERIRQSETDWKELMDQVKAEMEKGTDPASETVQALARRWDGLVREFTGGNPGIAQSLGKMWKEEPTVAGIPTGPMHEMMAYVGKARAAAKG
ncbi:MAG TPA: MerR family transcriptional regulator [Thermoanaerobaculia bacterium]|nr:MerR family transcriptional regulator [Thermoanaerobaculia bacterium]